MQRCKECGIPIQSGEFCSDKCEEKWLKRENPEQTDIEENKDDDDEVLFETHLSISPSNVEEDTDIKEEDIEKEANCVKTIFTAVANSDSDAVQDFIDRGEDIEAENEYGYTALHEAARVGDVRSAAFLINAGANVNAVNNKGWTPLHRASNYGNLDVVKLLIEKEAKINLQESEGLIPLVIAIEREHFDIAKYLVIKGGDPNAIGKKGRPALISALKKDRMRLAHLLIENGADPNAGIANESALLVVLKCGDLDFVKLLIEKGANPNILDAEGQTALIYALKYEYAEIAELFINNGAKVNCSDANGRTALHFATGMQAEKLVELILKKGAKPVVWNKYGQMPLHLSKSKNISKLLNRKMFPSKIVYSLRVFMLAFLLTSVTIPTIGAYIFSIFVFLTALFTDWPRKTSLRLYLLEIMAVYLLITSACGIHPDNFSYPYVFLLFPVAVFLLFNFFIRPFYVYFSTVNDDGKRLGFMEFIREFFVTRVSFSPITSLRTLNTIVIAVLLILSVVYNYDHLKKNDQYLLSHVFNAIPKVRIFKSSEGVVADKTKKIQDISLIRKKAEFKAPEPGDNKYYDQAIEAYLKKDFRAAIMSLEAARLDPAIEDRAKEIAREINRFSILWDRVSHPEKYKKKRRGSPIKRLIKYDKNISGGKLTSEILLLKHTSK